jgi:hypothetical protein
MPRVSREKSLTNPLKLQLKTKASLMLWLCNLPLAI